MTCDLAKLIADQARQIVDAYDHHAPMGVLGGEVAKLVELYGQVQPVEANDLIPGEAWDRLGKAVVSRTMVDLRVYRRRGHRFGILGVQMAQNSINAPLVSLYLGTGHSIEAAADNALELLAKGGKSFVSGELM